MTRTHCDEIRTVEPSAAFLESCRMHPGARNQYWHIETRSPTDNPTVLTGEYLRCDTTLKKQLPEQTVADNVSVTDLQKTGVEIRSEYDTVYGKCIRTSLQLVEWCHEHGIHADTRRFAIAEDPTAINLRQEPTITHHAVLIDTSQLDGAPEDAQHILVDVTLDQFHEETPDQPSPLPDDFPEIAPRNELPSVGMFTTGDPELEWYSPVPLALSGPITPLSKTALFDTDIHPTHIAAKRAHPENKVA